MLESWEVVVFSAWGMLESWEVVVFSAWGMLESWEVVVFWLGCAYGGTSWLGIVIGLG